jgi:uncharacterized protein (DUF934 family)
MPKYLSYPKGGQAKLIENKWQILRDQEIHPNQLPNGPIILSYPYFVKNQQELLARAKTSEIGVYFQVEDDVIEDQDFISENSQAWSVIAVDFPIFRDGRGFSTAAILREQFAWEKELCAVGDVLIDQLVQMSRVGFDSFVLRDDQNLETGLLQLNRFTVTMQNDWRGLRTLRLGKV